MSSIFDMGGNYWNDNSFWKQVSGLSGVTATNTASNVYTVTVNFPAMATPTITEWPWASLSSSLPVTVTTQQQLYQLWQQGIYQPPYYMGVDVSSPPETPAQKDERLKRQAEREAKRKAAEQRAEHLLFSILTPSQVKQYTDDNYFEQPVGSRIYRIRKGRSMNVELIEAGKPVAKYCAHSHDAHEIPVPDVMLSQMLMLQASEAEFLRIANRSVVQ